MDEKALEKKLKKEIEKLGGKCFKHSSPYHRGMPDRIVLLPDGLVYFVELKKEGGKLTKLQEKAKKDLLTLGQRYVLLEGEKGLRECLIHFKAVTGSVSDGLSTT